MSMHTRFVRALESEYVVQIAAAHDAGTWAEDAHLLGFEHVKARGAQALDELKSAGLYPFADGGDGDA